MDKSTLQTDSTTGSMPGDIIQRMIKMETRCNKTSLNRMLFCGLLNNKTGTKNVELKAEHLAKENEVNRCRYMKSRPGACVRDKGIVIALLNIKVKGIKSSENKAKRQLKVITDQVRDKIGEANLKILRSNRKEIGETNWAKGKLKIDSKIQRLTQRYSSCSNHHLCEVLREKEVKIKDSKASKKVEVRNDNGKNIGDKVNMEDLGEDLGEESNNNVTIEDVGEDLSEDSNEKWDRILKDIDDENEEVIRLTKIEDKDLGIDKEIEEPVIFGGAILSDDEKALLINRPEYATFGKLIRSDIQVEIEMGLAKIRWDRKKRGYKEESDSDSGIETGDEGNNDDLAKEAESRATYSRENKRLDMGNRRATDCKNNRRTYLSKARPLLEEAELLLRREAWDMVVKKYIEKHCNLKGNQNVNNLNESEQRGLRSLLKRVMDKEIVINSSDKGKRLVVSTLKSYEEQGKVHTSKDKETNLKEVLLMQRKLTSHSRALCNAFGAGKNHGDRNSQRVWDNVSSRSGTVPLLHLMPKLHKKYYENGNPQTRPVVGASSGMTMRASEVLCDVIDAVGKSHPDQQECPSTEACCNKMEDSEVIIEERGVNVIVGSIDAVGLYPNLNIPLAAREVSKEWMESGMEVDNFDYRAAGVYLASTCTKEAIIEVGLGGVIPERIHKKGPTPQVNTKENISRLKEKAARYVEIGHDEFEQENNTKEDKKVETKWGPMPEVMSPETKRKIVGLVIETAIINIMKMHCYRFEGKYFIQGGGGAIGLRLTGLVAKIVMARWARKLKYLIEKVVWCIYLFVIYVDDCNVYMEALEKGVYWDKENKNLGWSAEQEVMDASSGKSDARRTMDIFLQMANSIFTYVTFTSDLPEDHENGKCPMLDLMTWKERVEDKERPRGYKEVVKHSFYEKPVASKLVIMCKSAMPEKIKIVTNSQEIVRILRNCGNNITAGEKAEHLTSMMRKLRRSGYGVNMRKKHSQQWYNRILQYEEGGSKRRQKGKQTCH